MCGRLGSCHAGIHRPTAAMMLAAVSLSSGTFRFESSLAQLPTLTSSFAWRSPHAPKERYLVTRRQSSMHMPHTTRHKQNARETVHRCETLLVEHAIVPCRTLAHYLSLPARSVNGTVATYFLSSTPTDTVMMVAAVVLPAVLSEGNVAAIQVLSGCPSLRNLCRLTFHSESRHSGTKDN